MGQSGVEKLLEQQKDKSKDKRVFLCNMIHFTHYFTQGKRQMYRELLSNLTAIAETDLGECDPANIAGCTGTVLGKYDGNLYEIISSSISEF